MHVRQRPKRREHAEERADRDIERVVHADVDP